MAPMTTPDLTLAAAIERWVAARKAIRRLNAATERTYRMHIEKLVEVIGPDVPLRAVARHDVERWMATLDHMKANSLKTATEPARSLFKWAHEEELIDRDPMARIPRPRIPPPTYRALDRDVIGRMLHVADFRERTVVLVGLNLGLRCIEMSRVEVTDWDREQRWLAVRGKGAEGEITRMLPVQGEVERVLDMWIGPRKSGPLFPSTRGDRLESNSISQIVSRLAERAGVKATAHQLRHTCAHDMLAMGALPNAVQRFLGHANLATTSTYLAARDDELRAAMLRQYATVPGEVTQ